MKIQERIQLANVLPPQGNFETLVLIKSIKEKIQITSKEVEEFEITTTAGSTRWNETGVASDVEFDFSDGEKKVIKDSLKLASDKEYLPMDLMDMYELIAK